MKKKAEKQIKEKEIPVEPVFVSRFFWKKLSEDGLLKDADDKDSYYSINTYGGFESREDALRSWAIEAQRGRFVWGEFILIEEVHIENRHKLPRGY